ncbi:General substrate transporter [Metarhizium robertsii ARSEF 23]|uniref:General substrate transporter n=1 Tax=Metarhizium robertsii (strain ARSEF 23 / ATCC MYA-3075) TaxID=655844 RepID=A0A0B2XI35_METRA|nr:General substrate transporter [Metarhizium robertsii ARSEF 23]KHO11599.1 General substrate transporter [Metarhizium robertsii ARSEF 23]
MHPEYSAIVKELRDELLWEENDLEQAVKNARKWDIPELDKYGIISAKGFLDFADWLVKGWVPTESTQGRDIHYILCVFYFVLSQKPLGGRQTKIHPLSINQRMKPLSEWVFFYRKLNELRKIDGPDDDKIVVFPADSTFTGAYGINEDSEVVLKEEDWRVVKDEVVLKNVPWKVADLLGKYGSDPVPPDPDSKSPPSTYGDLFKGGIWTHAYLNVFDYHRQHGPVLGTVEVVDVIQGTAYLEVLVKTDEQVGHNYLEPSRLIAEGQRNPSGINTLDMPDTPGYQFLQTRGLVIIKNDNLGRVAVLSIGMATISSVVMREGLKPGVKIKKGEEISHFQFGGSDCVVMFEKKARVSGIPDSDPASREHFFYGEKLCRAYYKKLQPAKSCES